MSNMLPKIQRPTYKVTLPSNGKEGVFRPFTVKEENLLLLAKQEDDPHRAIQSVKQVIHNCTEDSFDVDELASFDVEKLFIMIRSKSVGESIQLQVECDSCGEKVPAMANLEQVEVVRPEGHTSTIMLDENVGVKMMYPTLKISERLSDANLDESTDPREAYRAMATCMDSIFDAEEVYTLSQFEEKDVLEWIEGLSRQQRDKIVGFFDTMPYVKVDVIYKCNKCNKEETKEVTGLQNFFV